MCHSPSCCSKIQPKFRCPLKGKHLLQAGYLDFHVSVRLQQEALSRIGKGSQSKRFLEMLWFRVRDWLQEQKFSGIGAPRAWQTPLGFVGVDLQEELQVRAGRGEPSLWGLCRVSASPCGSQRVWSSLGGIAESMCIPAPGVLDSGCCC